MNDQFHYDPVGYHERVVQIAEHVVCNDDLLTVSPRVDAETNSYHGAAIDDAERKRLSRAYPRLCL